MPSNTTRFRLKVALLLLLSSTAEFAMAETRATYTFGAVGFDVVTMIMASKASKELDAEFVIVNYPDFSSKLAAVQSGEIDFSAIVTYTKERSERLIFSAPTNMEYPYYFSLQNSNLQNIKTVGVPHDSVFSVEIKAYDPTINIVTYRSLPEAKQLIEDKEVDGVIDVLQALRFMLSSGMSARQLNFHYPFKPVSVVTGKQENVELLKRIEHYLHTPEMQKLMRELSESYTFDVQRQDLRKNVLLSGLDVTEPLKVKIGSFHQLGEYVSDSTVEGIAADVVFRSCELMRIECELVSTLGESWGSMLNSLVEENIDVLAPYALIEERYTAGHISNSFYLRDVIVVRRTGYKENVYRSISELFAERVGVLEGRIFEKVVRRQLPHKSLILYKEPEAQLEALIAKEVDYIVMTRTTFYRLLADSSKILPAIEDEMIGSFYSYKVGIGFQKNHQGQILQGLFNQALHILDVESILNHYNKMPDWQATLVKEKVSTQKNLKLFLMIIIGLIIISYFWHKQSVIDSLTRLKNRTALYKKYKNGLHDGQVLIYLDVNKFKWINDTYGHGIGDRVLKTISNNIARYWNFDSYRIGGDEFILIGNASESEISEVVSKIGIFNLSDRVEMPFTVTLSYGAFRSNGTRLPLDDCIHIADTEMYKHKRQSSIVD